MYVHNSVLSHLKGVTLQRKKDFLFFGNLALAPVILTSVLESSSMPDIIDDMATPSDLELLANSSFANTFSSISLIHINKILIHYIHQKYFCSFNNFLTCKSSSAVKLLPRQFQEIRQFQENLEITKIQ